MIRYNKGQTKDKIEFKQMKSPENGLNPNFSGLILVDHLGLEPRTVRL